MVTIKKGICLLSVIPMRAEPGDRSEMVSQMLFGETCDITIENEKWYHVITHFDNYTGWVDKKQVAEHHDPLGTFEKITIQSPNITSNTNKGAIQLYEGCELNLINDEYYAGNNRVTINADLAAYNPLVLEEMLIIALSMLNSPYLWGGRTRAGIDCSGFTQLMYKLMGKPIPRDASLQEAEGVSVNFNNICPGDLCFFHNIEGRVVHVGIIWADNRVIHSSGCIRIDNLNKDGIFNIESNTLSHSLHSIKRIII